MGFQILTQIPEIKLTDHFWYELERRLRSRTNRASSLLILTSAVMDVCKSIPTVTNQNVVENFPRRAQTVQKRDQHHNMCLREYHWVPNTSPLGCPYH
ncbi:hypothetical protein TNCV_4857901 [Trichonephila clavipes]|nr:hypothetical protein TNCV_4857901 [Trichonephila clavipes]